MVYLSKNSLTSLSGLEQFGSLRVLGLADNLLADMEQVGKRDLPPPVQRYTDMDTDTCSACGVAQEACLTQRSIVLDLPGR